MNNSRKNKNLLTGIVLLLCIQPIFCACVTSNNTSNNVPLIADGKEALNAVVLYLNDKYSDNIPGKDTV